MLMRPIFRKYEIPYLAKSNVSAANQIKADDLYLSVRGDQIFLRSKKLNKYVIPRLTTAHNFSFNALPVYQFLCDLQSQNLQSTVMFSWGPLENQYQFLPRVIFKNIILSRAMWNIYKADISHIYTIKDEQEQIEAIKLFAIQNHLPDEVLLADSDNELYLNLTNITCIKILLDLTKNRQSFKLKEFLFSDDNFVVKGSDGSYTNEIVVALHKNNVQHINSSVTKVDT